MAEAGTVATLVGEVNDAMPNADRHITIPAPDIGSSSTQTGVVFTSDHPRLTLTSMIAPTPDWFVGVSGLSLLDSSGNWRDSVTVDLYPWDAGTEDGTGFSLTNDPTDPQGVIASIRGRAQFTGARIARLVFTRTGTVQQAPAAPAGFALAPADGAVTLGWTVPAAAGITGHEYRQKAGGSYGAWTAIPDSAPSETNEDSFTVTGLSNGTLYTFQLRAVNAVGGGVSSAEVAATPNAPASGTVTITGTAEVGQTLTVSVSGVTDRDGVPSGVTYTYQWVQVDGTDETDIAGATSSTYTLVAADQGKRVKVKVSFEDDVGNDEELSSAAYPSSGTVGATSTDATLSALSLGTGVVLSPAFAGATTQYRAWVANPVSSVTVTATKNDDGATVAIAGDDDAATPATATLSLVPGRNTVAVTVTAEDGNTPGTYTVTAVREAAAPAADAAALLTANLTVGERDGFPGYNATLPPTIGAITDDDFEVDSTSYELSVLGVLGPNGVDRFNAETVAACFLDTAKPTEAVRNTLLLRIGGKSFRFDASTAITANDCYEWARPTGLSWSYGDIAPVKVALARNAIGAPTISGTAQVGETLTAARGSIDDADGLPETFPDDYAFQWSRVDSGGTNPMDIAGATSSTYMPVADDVGKKIRVEVSFEDLDLNPEARTSAVFPSGDETVAAAIPPARADVLVSNIGQENSNSIGLATDEMAMGFETGATAGGYTLGSIEVEFFSADDDALQSLTATLWTADENDTDIPGSSFATLNNPASLSAGVGTFSAPPNTTLSAGTDYFVHLSYSGDMQILVQRTLSDDEDDTSAEGWSIHGDRLFRTRGSSGAWDTNGHLLKIRVNDDPTPSITTPEPPTALQAAPYGDNAVLLSWTAPASGTTPTGYKVEVSADAGVNWADAEDDTGATVTSWIHAGLTASATRHYRVSALAPGGSSEPSGTASATTCDAGVPWCPTMIAGTGSTGLGASSGFDSLGSPPFGSLSPDSFRHGGSTYASEVLVHGTSAGDTRLVLKFDSALPAALAGFALRSGTHELSLASAVHSVSDFTYTWTGPPFGSWSDGQRVAFEFALANRPATGAPAISGTARVGETLTAAPGNIADADGRPAAFPEDYTFQWIREDSGGTNATNIGTDSSTYALVGADEGKKIKVRVSFTDDEGNDEELTSAAYPSGMETVTGASPTTAATLVSNSGQKSDRDLTVGQITPTSRFTIAQKFTTGANEGGYRLSKVVVNITATYARSDPRADIFTVNASGNPGRGLYALTPETGARETFTAPDDATTLAKETDYFVVFYSGSSQTDGRYVLAATDSDNEDAGGQADWEIGDSRHFRTESGGSWSTSTSHVPVFTIKGTLNAAAIGAPAISGMARVGETLTAALGSIDDADGRPATFPDGYTFQWSREDSDGSNRMDISGATSSTYALVTDDVGKKIKVEVSFQDTDGNDEEVTSAVYPSRGTVGDANAATGEPEISGTVAVGSTLTASPNPGRFGTRTGRAARATATSGSGSMRTARRTRSTFRGRRRAPTP